MSQPLVVKIHAFGEDIATIHYRWGAYTWSSLTIADELIQFVNWGSCTTKDDLILKLKHHIEQNGGGVDSTDWSYFECVYPSEVIKKNNVNGSDGLIAISEFGMNDQLHFACGEMTIDYDEQEIYNSCYQYYECLDDYISSYGDDLDMPEAGFKHIKIDPSHFSFNQLNDVKNELTGGEFFLFGEELFGVEEG